jgi:hypothetical protein
MGHRRAAGPGAGTRCTPPRLSPSGGIDGRDLVTAPLAVEGPFVPRGCVARNERAQKLEDGRWKRVGTRLGPGLVQEAQGGHGSLCRHRCRCPARGAGGLGSGGRVRPRPGSDGEALTCAGESSAGASRARTGGFGSAGGSGGGPNAEGDASCSRRPRAGPAAGSHEGDRPLPHREHHEDVRGHSRAAARRRAAAPAGRLGGTVAAWTASKRRRDDPPSAARPHQWAVRLRR